MARRGFSYSRWDGTQRGFDLDADSLLSEMADDLTYHGDLNAALRRLLQQGFRDRNGEELMGLREMLERLRERRRQEVESKDLGGPFAEIAERLREIRSEAWAIGDEDPVDVTLRLDREVVGAFVHEYPELTAGAPDAEGRQEVTLSVNHRAGLFKVVLQLLERIEVVGPDEVRAQFVAHLQSLAAGE